MSFSVGHVTSYFDKKAGKQVGPGIHESQIHRQFWVHVFELESTSHRFKTKRSR